MLAKRHKETMNGNMTTNQSPKPRDLRLEAYQYLKANPKGFKEDLLAEIGESLFREFRNVGILSEGMDGDWRPRYKVTDFGMERIDSAIDINNMKRELLGILQRRSDYLRKRKTNVYRKFTSLLKKRPTQKECALPTTNQSSPKPRDFRLEAYQYLKANPKGFKEDLLAEIGESLFRESCDVGILSEGMDGDWRPRYKVTDFGMEQVDSTLELESIKNRMLAIARKYPSFRE